MTSSMPWVKLYTEMLDDPKIGRLTPALRWRFVELVLLAGECDAEGYLVKGDEPMTTEDIAWRLRCDKDDLVVDMERLLEVGLVENEDGVWLICKFAERQGRSQAEKREQWRERQRSRRERDTAEKKKSVTGDIPDSKESVTSDSRVSHGGVTPLEERREEEEGEEELRGGAAPSPDPLAADDPGARLFFAILGTEFAAKKRKPPKRFPSLASKQKFTDKVESRLSLDQIRAATTRACEKNITSISGAVDFVAKWGLDPPARNGHARKQTGEDPEARRAQERAAARARIEAARARQAESEGKPEPDRQSTDLET